MRAALVFLVVVTGLSVGTGMVFSLSYWGYAWSIPEVDSRTHDVTWTSISGFTSNQGGTEWTRDADRDLQGDVEPAPDSECCPVARIVKVAGRSDFAAIEQADVTAIQNEALSLVDLESGEPGYVYAKRLYGVLALGRDSTGQPMAFASFLGGEVSNDHHPMYEVLWQRGAAPRLLSSRKYYGDVAGIEGFEAPQVATLLFVPFAAIGLFLVTMWRAVESMLSRRKE